MTIAHAGIEREWSVNDRECFEHTNTFHIGPSTKESTITTDKLPNNEDTTSAVFHCSRTRPFQRKKKNLQTRWYKRPSDASLVEYRKRRLTRVEFKYVPCFLSLSFLGLEDLGRIWIKQVNVITCAIHREQKISPDKVVRTAVRNEVHFLLPVTCETVNKEENTSPQVRWFALQKFSPKQPWFRPWVE